VRRRRAEAQRPQGRGHDRPLPNGQGEGVGRVLALRHDVQSNPWINLKQGIDWSQRQHRRARPRSRCRRGNVGTQQLSRELSNTPRDLIRTRRASQRVETVMQEKIGYCRQQAAECAARAQEAPTRTRASFFSDSGIHGSKQRSDTSRRPRPLPTRARSGGRLRLRPSLARTTGVRARTTHARTRRRSGSERHDDISSMPLSLSFEFSRPHFDNFGPATALRVSTACAVVAGKR
jgi:hypothetical protein